MRVNFSEAQIEELRKISEDDFGRSVSSVEARQMAVTLFDLYQWLTDLISSGKVDDLIRELQEDETHVGSA